MIFLKRVTCLLLASLLLTACATTAPVGNTDYMQSSQYQGPTNLGVRYLLGRGVQQSDTKAFSYFIIAADDDDAFAQNEVAYMYAAGKGTSQNYAKAFEYYQKAANHGLASAQYNLGLLYMNGLGTAQNREQAMQWFQKSAASGFEPAKRALTQYAS